MLREEIKGLLASTTRDLRKFGLVVGGIFCVLGLWFFIRHKPFYWYVLAPGVPLMLLGAILPRSLKWVYIVWMTLAIALGTVVSTILLTVLFFVVVTPIGLAARLAGKDFLGQKLQPGASSYWILRDATKLKEKHEHEQQF
jgi:hypothetical protein